MGTFATWGSYIVDVPLRPFLFYFSRVHTGELHTSITKKMADLALQQAPTVDTQRGDVEVGVTDAIQEHFARHVVERKPISQARLNFEHSRPRWLRYVVMNDQ